MDINALQDLLKLLSDENLFEVLNTVSNEVSRRNKLSGPSITDIKNNSPEQNVKNLVEALSKLGINNKNGSK